MNKVVFVAVWVSQGQVHNLMAHDTVEEAAEAAVMWTLSLRREGFEVILQREASEIVAELKVSNFVEVLIEDDHRIEIRRLKYLQRRLDIL